MLSHAQTTAASRLPTEIWYKIVVLASDSLDELDRASRITRQVRRAVWTTATKAVVVSRAGTFNSSSMVDSPPCVNLVYGYCRKGGCDYELSDCDEDEAEEKEEEEENEEPPCNTASDDEDDESMSESFETHEHNEKESTWIAEFKVLVDPKRKPADHEGAR
ncbi:hypothetical protein DFJ73DRAFT_862311 [Zopfochytrium polystomum]|nr:hypothetical protein DFJ73DRAFT_862311 [Zopfochytrium polystomum]